MAQETKLKITDSNGKISVVPFKKKTLDVHLRRNKIENAGKRLRLEEVTGLEMDAEGKITNEGKVVKVHHKGAINAEKLQAETAKALTEKDKEIEELKKQLAAKSKEAPAAKALTEKDKEVGK